MRRYGEQPQIGAAFRLAAHLLRDARRDPATAWLAYRRAMDGLDTTNGALADELEAIDAALDERRADDAIAAADAALPRARDTGLNPMTGALLSRRGHAYLQQTAGDRATNQEQAIADFEAALDIMEPDTASAVLMHLAIVYAERLRGDPDDNRFHAAALLRQALDIVPPADPERRAIIETDLATTLLRQEHGDDAANTARGRLALPQRAPSPVAGARPGRLGLHRAQPRAGRRAARQAGRSRLDDARALYGDVIQHRDAIRAPWLVGAAYQGLGRLELTASWRDPERIIEEHAAGRFEEYMDNEAELQRARAASSRRARSRVTRPTRRFTATSSLGSPTSSRSSGRLTTRSMPAAPRSRSSGPTPLPRPATAAVTVAALLAESGRWSKPPDAYRVAVEAAELALNSYRDPRARAGEIREPRRCAALGRLCPGPGRRAREAALILDTGVPGELRRRFASVRQSRTPTSRRPASRAGRSYM